MKEKNISKYIIACSVVMISCSENNNTKIDKPNIIILLTDDQGYGDMKCYGNDELTTPHLDMLAQSGTRFTSFCSGAASSTPSRAALMTGRYAERTGLPSVVDDTSDKGLRPTEYTLADYLKQNGYATGMFGKWHLGCLPEHLPRQHGFDEFFGIPYSNDMWRFHPAAAHPYKALPLYDNEEIIEYNPNINMMTTRLTERAVNFINKHKDEPFLLYLPYTQPHVPLGVSDKFKGKSGKGLYADVIMEIDWSVGEIIKSLKRNKLESNTIVIFSSDNGPWLCYGNHAGSNGGLREGKGTTFEGGQRVPMIISMPGTVPSEKISDSFFSAVDIVPTLLSVTNTSMPKMNDFDGENVWNIICGKDSVKNKEFYYINNGNVEAVRKGNLKFIKAHNYRIVTEPGKDGLPGIQLNKGGRTENALFDLKNDPYEKNNILSSNIEVGKEMETMIDSMSIVINQELAK